MIIPWGPTGREVYSRTYSRPKEDGSRETWPETVSRVVSGNLALVYGDDRAEWSDDTRAEARALEEYMLDFAVLPAGRHLWATGATTMLYNCWSSDWAGRFSDHFAFTAARLFEGGGVGSNYSTKYLKKYGAPRRHVEVQVECDPGHPDFEELRKHTVKYFSGTGPAYFEVEDSREGWADALAFLIDVAMADACDYASVIFNVSKVRPSGSPLVTSGGTASGPAPFAKMVRDIARALNDAHVIDTLTPLHAMAIDHAIAEAVVSGGTRRSARMSIVHWDDPHITQFINSKSTDVSKNWTTNISVAVDDDFFRYLAMADDSSNPMSARAKAVHHMVVWGMLENGEPGYWNYSLSQEGEPGEIIVTNPCQPEWATLLTPSGISTMGEIEVGDTIWSEDGWVKVVRKTHTGVKQVNRYRTTAGYVDATENHRIVSNGVKVELKDAETIDRLRGAAEYGLTEPKDVMAGLLLGDGHVHHTGHGKYAWTVLSIGKDDQDYFDSEIADLIIGRHGSDIQFRAADVIDQNYLVPLPERRIPEEYMGNASVLRGLYSANGSIVGGRVTFKTASPGMRDDIMVSLSSLGIASYYTTNKPSVIQWPNGTYESRESFDVNIGRGDDIQAFAENIGFIHGYKTEKLTKILRASNTKKDKTFAITSVESMGEHDVYDITVDGAHHTYWSDGMNVSNCGEIPLSAWEPCCLGHVNLDYFAPKEKGGRPDLHGMEEAHRLITRFLVRATFGSVNDEKSRAILDKNRRIGVGHLGVQGYWAKLGVAYSQIPAARGSGSFLQRLYHEVRLEARAYAEELGIPEPVKVTTVAPTGSIAKLPGVSEGIHPIYARHFERRIRYSLRDAGQANTVLEYAAQGYETEVDQYDSSGQTAIVVFPTEDILVGQVRAMGYDDSIVESADEISVRDMLKVQELYQACWADNAVSYTVNVRPGSVSHGELAALLQEFLPHLKGTTVMVDGSRPQAPYTRISAGDYADAANKTISDGSDECSSGACPVK